MQSMILQSAHNAATTSLPVQANPHKRINSQAVRDLCGGISDMTLYRWLADTSLNFPKPVVISRRRFWKEAEILAWLEAREVQA